MQTAFVPKFVRILINELRSPSHQRPTRFTVSDLGRIGPPAIEAIPALIKLIDTPTSGGGIGEEGDFWFYLANSLVAIAPGDPTVIEAVLRRLQKSDILEEKKNVYLLLDVFGHSNSRAEVDAIPHLLGLVLAYKPGSYPAKRVEEALQRVGCQVPDSLFDYYTKTEELGPKELMRRILIDIASGKRSS